MTRKDFNLIARCINQAANDQGQSIEGREAIRGLIDILATELKTTNPAFNRVRFVNACLLTQAKFDAA